MKNLTTIVLFSALATRAFAHSRVDAATPSNGATVAKVPAEISFSFMDGIRLTKLK